MEKHILRLSLHGEMRDRMVLFGSKWNLHAGLHWWKPRPSGRTQSSLKNGGFFLSAVGDGEYVAGVAPPLPAIFNHGKTLYLFTSYFHFLMLFI